MASGMSQTLAQSVLDAIFNGVDFSFGTAYLALHTTAPTATAFGTEVTGGSYARPAISAGIPAAGAIASDATALFSNMPACTIAGAAIVDTPSGAPTSWLYIDGMSRVVSAGENLTVEVGDLTASLT